MIFKKFINSVLLLLAISITNYCFAVVGGNWQLKWNTGSGSGAIQSKHAHSGTHALSTTVKDSTGKRLFMLDKKIAVTAGKSYVLSCYAKSTTSAKAGARIMLQYLDKNGKYIGTSHGIYVGGNHDWQYFERIAKIPTQVAFIRLIAGSYQVAGISWFDEIKLIDSNQQILVSVDFEPKGNSPVLVKTEKKQLPSAIKHNSVSKPAVNGKAVTAVNIKSENWKLHWNNAGGSGKITHKVVKIGKYALMTKTPTAKSKALYLRAETIKVTPGSEYLLSGYIKSTTAQPGNARIMLQYLDKQGKYTTVSHGVYGGGTHDWKLFQRTTTIPKGVYFVRLIAGNYMAAGCSWFDAIKLTTTDQPPTILAEDGFENVIEKSANVWSIPIKIAKKSINALVEIKELKVNYDLVHFTGTNSLKYLDLTCDYKVVKPGNCYLSSNVGTCYWYSVNLSTLKMSLFWSGEKISLAKVGEQQVTIPFQQRYQRYFSPINKGENVIRGHHYFRVYDLNGHAIGSSASANSLAHPEAAVFGKKQVQISKSNRESLYTLANLTSYKLNIADFQADWKPNGKFAFKITITDADNDLFRLNKVTDLTVLANGQPIVVTQLFAPYDIPTGWFIGKLPNIAVKNINVTATITANTPQGKKLSKIAKVFSQNGQFPKFTAKVPSMVAPTPKNEIRMVFITPHSILSQEPAAGKTAIVNLVAQAKATNINILTPFILGNRCNSECATNSKYRKTLFKKYDPMLIFREECSKAKIGFHPAVCLLPEGVETLEGILREHPEWAMRKTMQKKGGWLDPAVPAARAYRVAEIADIARRYKVDGIMLDYARLAIYPSDRGAEIYLEKFGVDPRKYKYGTPEHIKWFKWESKNLDTFVSEVHDALKKVDPKIKISAYIQGTKYAGTAAWEDLHQNYLEWIKQGDLDIICPTGYIYDMLRFKAWSKLQIDACHKVNPNIPCAVTIGVLSSHGALSSSQEMIDQINILRQLGGEGASFFRWKYMTKWFKPLREKCYSTAVNP